MTTFLMYLLVKLDMFINVSLCLFVLHLVGVVFEMFVEDEAETEDEKKIARKKVSTYSALTLLFLGIATFLPTTKQAAFIWVAPQIIENGAVKSLVEMTSSQATKDTVANIPELTKLGTEYLKQMLKDEINDNKSDKEM